MREADRSPSGIGPTRPRADDPATTRRSGPAITTPAARVWLARVSWRTSRSKCCKSNLTVSSPRLIDSSDVAQDLGQQGGDPLEVVRGPGRLRSGAAADRSASCRQVAEEGADQSADVEVGVKVAAHSLDRDQGTDQEDQGRAGSTGGAPG